MRKVNLVVSYYPYQTGHGTKRELFRQLKMILPFWKSGSSLGTGRLFSVKFLWWIETKSKPSIILRAWKQTATYTLTCIYSHAEQAISSHLHHCFSSSRNAMMMSPSLLTTATLWLVVVWESRNVQEYTTNDRIQYFPPYCSLLSHHRLCWCRLPKCHQ